MLWLTEFTRLCVRDGAKTIHAFPSHLRVPVLSDCCTSVILKLPANLDDTEVDCRSNI